MPKKPETPLVIHCLEAENIKRLKAISIKPDGSLVEVTGRNGQGKTSVLDAIWWALTGTNHVQAKPIREGQEKARIRLDLGDIVVTRRYLGGIFFRAASTDSRREERSSASRPSPAGMSALSSTELLRPAPR